MNDDSATRSLVGGRPLSANEGADRAIRLHPAEGIRWIGTDRLLVASTGSLLSLAANSAPHARRLLAGATTSTGDEVARRLVETGAAHPDLTATALVDPGLMTCVVPFGGGDLQALRRLVDMQAEDGCLVVVDDRGHGDALDLDAGGTVVRHDENRGPAAARNTGWRLARTPLVAFADADTVPAAGWARRVARHFALDDRLALVAPRIRSTSGPGLAARYERVRCPLDMGTAPGLVRHGTPLSYVPSTAWVVRREALEDVGGFDEAMRLGEDVDLVWRLERRGWRIRYEPTEVVEHEPRATVRAWLHQRTTYGRSSADLWARHGEWLRHLEVAPRSTAPWVVAAALGPLPGAIAVLAASGLEVRDLPLPARQAVRVALTSQWRQGVRMAEYMRRVGLLPAVVLACKSPAVRRLLAVSALPYLADWWRQRPDLGVGKYCGLRLADDVAYGIGAWRGAIDRRDLGSLAVGVRSPRR